MSVLTYNIDHKLTMTAGNVSINAAASFTLDSTAYDSAFYFVGKNIFTGDYSSVANNGDLISSNLSIDQANFNSAEAYFINSANVGGLGNQTAYGQAISRTLGYTETAYTTALNLGSEDLNTDEFSTLNTNALIPMIKLNQALPNINLALPVGNTSVGQSLLNAVGIALFKNLGHASNVAILNDSTAINDLQNKLHTAMNLSDGNGLAESNNTNSLFFQRYKHSGRFRADVATAGNSGDSNYNMDNVEIRFKLAITGNVADGGNDVDLTNQTISRQIIGDETAGETLVTNGTYTTNLLIVIRQDSRI